MIKYFINYQKNNSSKTYDIQECELSKKKKNVCESTCTTTKNNNLILDLNKMKYNKWDKEDLYELTINTR